MSQRKLLEGNSQNYFDKDESESLKLIKYWPNPKYNFIPRFLLYWYKINSQHVFRAHKTVSIIRIKGPEFDSDNQI